MMDQPIHAALHLLTDPPVGVARSAPAVAALQSPALAAVIRERLEQVETHGYDARHHALHDECEIALGALAYLLSGLAIETGEAPQLKSVGRDVWPWTDELFRPADYAGCLVKAAAMLIAEADRVIAAQALLDFFRPGA